MRARPSSSEAVALLAARNGDAKLLAGGQSLVPMLAFRLAAPALLVDLRKLPELRKIEISGDGVVLGSMVRWCDILADARLRTAHPLLCAAVAERGALSNPQSRHDRRQHRACRSGRRDARHRARLRGADRHGRQAPARA